MVIRELSFAIQDFLCASFVFIYSQVILRENSSIPVGKSKFEREDTEVIRESFQLLGPHFKQQLISEGSFQFLGEVIEARGHGKWLAILQGNEFEQLMELNPHLPFIKRAKATISPQKAVLMKPQNLKCQENPSIERHVTSPASDIC